MDEYKQWLQESGVQLPERRMERLALKVASELELRVGDSITEHLSAEQLEEFERVVAEARRQQVAWLEENYPQYTEVVTREKEKLHEQLSHAKNAAILIKRWR
jgi:hypothetical protein